MKIENNKTSFLTYTVTIWNEDQGNTSGSTLAYIVFYKTIT